MKAPHRRFAAMGCAYNHDQVGSQAGNGSSPFDRCGFFCACGLEVEAAGKE